MSDALACGSQKEFPGKEALLRRPRRLIRGLRRPLVVFNAGGKVGFVKVASFG